MLTFLAFPAIELPSTPPMLECVSRPASNYYTMLLLITQVPLWTVGVIWMLYMVVAAPHSHVRGTAHITLW